MACSSRELAELPPKGRRRMGMNPHANGGLLLAAAAHAGLPRFRDRSETPGEPTAEATRILGKYLREVMKCNLESKNFRVFGPDETASNRLEAIYDVSKKTWESETLPWTKISRSMAASWKCSANTCARAGSKAIC